MSQRGLGRATLHPARYLAADTLGTIAAGRVADFVVLEADPLQNIRNTSRVRAVVVDGRYLSAEELDSLVADVEQRLAGNLPR